VNNFWQRILTGSVFTGSIVAAIWWGPVPFVLLFLLAALLSLNEFYSLIQNDGPEINRKFGMVCGFLLYLLIALRSYWSTAYKWEVLIFPLLSTIFIVELYRKKANPFSNIGFTLLGILYTVLPFALLMKFSVFSGDYDRGILLGYFLLLWSSDSFAYVFGNLFGKHRLFERISPKKSWEGSIGGGLSTLGVAHVAEYLPATTPLVTLDDHRVDYYCYRHLGRPGGIIAQTQPPCEGFRIHFTGSRWIIRPI
jgi:phosphatidate cytidylyltransferase